MPSSPSSNQEHVKLINVDLFCLVWREWDFVGALFSRSAADRVAATRAHASQAEYASCHCNQNFCPPSGSDTHLQIRRAPRSAATWVDADQYRSCSIVNKVNNVTTGDRCSRHSSRWGATKNSAVALSSRNNMLFIHQRSTRTNEGKTTLI